MHNSSLGFGIDDTKTFDENMAEFSRELLSIDPALGPVLAAYIPNLLDGTASFSEVWNALLETNAAENPG